MAMKLILLPGLDGTGKLFRRFIECLPQPVEPVIITYPQTPATGYTALTELVRRQLPRSEDFLLLGESFSAAIAFEIARRPPRGLRGVIFVAGFLNNPRPWLLPVSRLLPRKILLRNALPQWLTRACCLGRDSDPDLLRELQQTLNSVSPNIIVDRLEQIEQLHSGGRIDGLPAVYLQAGQDRLVPGGASGFQSKISDLVIKTVAGPHFLLQARPRACVDALIECSILKTSEPKH